MVKKMSVGKPGQEPQMLSEPQTAEDFTQRGWNHYTKKEYFRAETDFYKALELSPDNPDILYPLALTLQTSGRPKEAADMFEKVIQLYSEPAEENRVRALMVTRLAKGHINRIKTGEWHIFE
jgi:tetratricopeptide (TPR) repeat protein